MDGISPFCFLEFQLARVKETKKNLLIEVHELVIISPPLVR